MIKDALFAKYMKLRQNADIIELGDAFLFYRIERSECFICDIFVEPGARKRGEFRKLIKELEKIAINKNCDHLSGNVFLNDPNANRTIFASIGVGFKIVGANNGCLTLVKKIMEDEKWAA